MPEQQTVEPPRSPAGPPLPPPGVGCRICRGFEEVSRTISGLADADALPASVYFRVNALMGPGRHQHMRYTHPDVWAAEQQAAAARAAALGVRSAGKAAPPAG